jgi:hypothetical protein
VLVASSLGTLLGACGPFSDVTADSFCPLVLEIFFLGVTTGTTPTTYDPASPVSRLQMAAFLSRTVDEVARRGSRRAAIGRFWTPGSESALALTTVGPTPTLLRSDGADVWTAQSDGTVSRVRVSDGRLLETWTGATSVFAVLVAMGRVFAVGGSPGTLYRIDPAQPAGAMTVVASGLGDDPRGMAFDGARIWTANNPSVSIVTPGATLPWTVTTVSAGFSSLRGALFDGSDVWVVAYGLAALLKLDSSGAILQSVTVGAAPEQPVFDGANIWVPAENASDVTVVRASTGAVLATLTGNGLSLPFAAAFDGERVLVTNATGDRVSLFKAADLSPLGSFSLPSGSGPLGACSDGFDFWIALGTAGKLARF